MRYWSLGCTEILNNICRQTMRRLKRRRIKGLAARKISTSIGVPGPPSLPSQFLTLLGLGGGQCCPPNLLKALKQ